MSAKSSRSICYQKEEKTLAKTGLRNVCIEKKTSNPSLPPLCVISNVLSEWLLGGRSVLSSSFLISQTQLQVQQQQQKHYHHHYHHHHHHQQQQQQQQKQEQQQQQKLQQHHRRQQQILQQNERQIQYHHRHFSYHNHRHHHHNHHHHNFSQQQQQQQKQQQHQQNNQQLLTNSSQQQNKNEESEDDMNREMAKFPNFESEKREKCEEPKRENIECNNQEYQQHEPHLQSSSPSSSSSSSSKSSSSPLSSPSLSSVFEIVKAKEMLRKPGYRKEKVECQNLLATSRTSKPITTTTATTTTTTTTTTTRTSVNRSNERCCSLKGYLIRGSPSFSSLHLRCHYRILLFTFLLLHSRYSVSQAKAPPETVETLATWTAKLPCRVENIDNPQLVLWYRRRENHPFYSYDARRGNLSSGSGRVHDDILGPRSNFVLVDQGRSQFRPPIPGTGMHAEAPVFPGYLELSRITRQDAGGYSCRVDFRNSPTQTHRLHLVVYEKPTAVTVIDGQSRTLVPGRDGVLTAGPLNHTSNHGDPYSNPLKTSLLLTCNVQGGWPPPRIEWMRGETVLPSSTDDGGDGSLGSRLYISDLKPDDYMTEVKCVVTNNNLTAPIVKRIRIDMNIEPAVVEITGLEKGLVAGAKHEVKCISHGSRPPANLTWDLEGVPNWSPLQVTQTITRSESSETTVTWTPQPKDNNKRLSCKATNPRNQAFTLSNTTTLNVLHPPIVQLSIGRGLDPSTIKEGVDVYFTCDVRSNPRPTSIVFFHEGVEVVQERKGRGGGGVLVTGNSLVLQKVTRGVSGRYSCKAHNSMGNQTSNYVNLDILYEPRCVVSSQTVTATPGENVTVECKVDAFPPPHRFSWSLNTTQGLHAVPKEQFSWSGGKSHMVYATSPGLKRSLALCWAANELGRLRQPCVTSIVAAGVPESVEQCLVVEQRVSSLRVSCTPGFDGGLEQHFIALLMDPVTNRVVANVTVPSPEFSLGDLEPGLDYVVKVISYNKRGRSLPYILDRFSLKVAENRMDSGAGGPGKGASPLLALFIGVVAAFVLTLIVIIVATKLRCRARATSREAEDDGDGGGGTRSEDEEDEEGIHHVLGGTRQGRRSSVEVKLMSVVSQEDDDLMEDSLKQQQLRGHTASTELDSPREYTRLETKTTSESLYSSCNSHRCGIGYSTESAMLLSSSPSASSRSPCSAGMGLFGPSAGGGGAASGVCSAGGVVCSGGSGVCGGGGVTAAPCSSGSGSVAGTGSVVGVMYGSLGRSLGQSWGQYSTLTRPAPPAHDPSSAGPRFHTLSTSSCTRRPSESFV